MNYFFGRSAVVLASVIVVVSCIVFFYVLLRLDRSSRRVFVDRKEFGPDSGLKVVNHRLETRDGRWVILGKVKNHGKDGWRNIKIEAELFDEKGGFVGEEHDYLMGVTLSPGEEEDFMMRSFRRSTPSFKTYKVKVANAREVGR